MDKQLLQRHLYERIPISRAMGIEVMEATHDAIILSEALKPNVNHHGTLFAGSAWAAALLAAWSLLFFRLNDEALESRCMISSSAMRYYGPITSRVTAISAMSDSIAWQRFANSLKQNRRDRLTLTAVLHCKGEKVGELEVLFTASGE